MITVNFVGGAKKWFNTSKLSIDKNGFNVKQLIQYLIEIKPKNSVEFNEKNLLIAINGVDSSALDGFETKLKTNDVVNIIPIIHGGSHSRIKIKISGYLIETYEFQKNQKLDHNFLESLRIEFPKIIIQAISSDFILSRNHIKKIISLSISAKKHDLLLSKKLETDILLRFAGTTQINNAIKKVGLVKNKNFFLIAIGAKQSLDKLYNKIYPNLVTPFSNTNQILLKKHFNITKSNLDAIESSTPLEDLLVEKAVILI